MKKTINSWYELRDEFIAYDRDYFSGDGYDFILTYFDDIDENTELDVIGICGDFSEYGDGASLSFSDFFSDYSSEYEEIRENTEDFDDLDDGEKIDLLVDYINYKGYCSAYILDAGDVMIVE